MRGTVVSRKSDSFDGVTAKSDQPRIAVDGPLTGASRTLLAAAWIVVCFLMIYLPDCGLGFLKDDYSWIETSRIHGAQSMWRLFREAPMGFYRPLVSLSFGINDALAGLNPEPYGLTNLTLALLTATAIGWLLWRL